MILKKRKQAVTGQSRRQRVSQYIVFVMFLSANLPALADQGPLLAAASSLRSLWPALMQAYTYETSEAAPRVSFASSGLLSTQILNGAPFEIFLSADVASIKRLPPKLLKNTPKVFARGSLSLVVPEASPLADGLSMTSLAAALSDSASKNSLRVAIPNPVHAPYGIAAQEALHEAGIRDLSASQLLAAENAAQTLQFVQTGAVAAAIVPQVLVTTQGGSVVWAEVPELSYRPVEHVVAVFKSASASAETFVQWLPGKSARQLMEEAGLQATGGNLKEALP